MLQNPQFTKLTTSMPQFYHYIMEGLFTHFFPDTGDSTTVYSKEDIEFFLVFANEQNSLEDITQTIHPYDQSIYFSKLKFYLDRILCRGWNNNGTDARPLNFYNLEVNSNIVASYIKLYILLMQACNCVGQTILNQCPGVTLSDYIPLYHQKVTRKNQVCTYTHA